MAKLVQWAAIPGALLALVALWGSLGFPTLATGADIERLDRGQAEIAVQTYGTKVRGLLVLSPPSGTVAHGAWQEELRSARDDLRRAEERRIQLGR